MDVGAALRLDVNVEIEAVDVETGEVVFRDEQHNLVTTSGLNVIADGIAGSGDYSADANVTHVGVGTGVAAVVAGDTDLGAEVFRGAVTKITRTGQSAVFELFLTSTQANGSTLYEAGLFNGDTSDAAPRDQMFARVTHAPISKTSSVQVTYRWTIALTAA